MNNYILLHRKTILTQLQAAQPRMAPLNRWLITLVKHAPEFRSYYNPVRTSA